MKLLIYVCKSEAALGIHIGFYHPGPALNRILANYTRSIEMQEI